MAGFITESQRQSIIELYVGYFNRAPEANGLSYWGEQLLTKINAGKTEAAALTEIADSFYDAGVQYGIYSNAMTVEAFIKAGYKNSLGRDLDAESAADRAVAIDYWSPKLNSGEVSKGAFIQQLISDAKGFAGDPTWGWVATYMANRVAVGEWFADNSASLTGDAAITQGTNAVSPVTQAAVKAGQTAAEAVTAAQSSTVTGQTYTLTTGIDTLEGTSGDDTFIGTLDTSDATKSSFQVSDTIDGKAGTDTLQLTASKVNAADDDMPAATMTNIEKVFVRNVGGNELDVNTSLVSGGKEFWNDRSTSIVEFESVAAGSTIGVKGNNSLAVAATKAGYVVGATAGSLAIDGGVKGGNAITVTGTGLTSFDIASTGVKNTVGAVQMTASSTVETLTIDASADLTTGNITGFTTTKATTVTVKGAGAVNIGTLAATVDTVNAADNSGGLTAVLGAGTTKVTGGSGNDVIDVQALNVTKDIDAGAGDGDTVVFTNSTNYSTTAAKLANFEVLRAGTAGTYDFSKISGLTGIEAQGGTLVFNKLGASTPVKALDSSTKLTFTLADPSGDSDALNLTIDDDATTPGALTLAEVATTGIETLNITTADALAAGTSHKVTAITGTGVKTVNVSGDSDFTLTNATGMAALEKIDGTGLGTNALTVGGAAQSGISAGDTVIGAGGDDGLFIAFGSLGTTTAFTAGAGDDTLTVIGDGSDIVDGDFAQVSGVENLTITSTTTTDVKLAGFAQSAIATVDGNLDIAAVLLTDSSTIDASDLVTQGVDIKATLTIGVGATDSLTIKGGAKADTFDITADDSADGTLTTSIDAGDGIDVVKFTATSAEAADVATFVTDAVALANADLITGFVENNAATILDYNGSLQAAVSGNVVTNATLNGAFGTATQAVYINQANVANSGSNTQGDAFAALLASDADSLAANWATLETQLLATSGALNGTFSNLDAAIANTKSALIVLDNGTGSALIRITNDTTTANTITASEIDLVGVLTDADGLVAADFA